MVGGYIYFRLVYKIYTTFPVKSRKHHYVLYLKISDSKMPKDTKKM